MAVVTTIAFAVGAALTTSRRRGFRLVLGSTAAAVAASAIVGIGAVASGTNAGAGLNRAVGDLSIYGIRPLELVFPAAKNIVLGDRLDSFWNTHAHGSNQTEITGYLGLLTLVLALSWLFVAVRRWGRLSQGLRVATAGLVATFAAGLAFAAPSPILLFGHKVCTPSRLLWEALPAFRVPSRWDPALMTALVPLAALGLQALWLRLTRDGRLGLATGVVGTAMVVSFLELAIHPAEVHFRTVPTPPEYAAVMHAPRGLLAEYPLGYSDIYRLWQRRHGRPIVNGAPADTTADYARLVLLDPAQPGTAQALSLLGVTVIALHPHAHVDAEVAPQQPRAATGYALLGRFPHDTSVWRVVARPAPAFATLPGGFGKPLRERSGLVVYPLVSTAGVALVELRSKQARVVSLVFEALPPSGRSASLRVADDQHEQAFALTGPTHVAVNVNVPRGVSQLLVKTDPPPASAADAILLSAPRAEQGTGTAVLQAKRVSPEPGF